MPALVHQQPASKKKYLWSYSGSAHGAGKQLRQVLDEECKLSDKCHGHFKPKGAGYLKECGGNLFNKQLDRRHDKGCVAMMDVKSGTIAALLYCFNQNGAVWCHLVANCTSKLAVAQVHTACGVAVFIARHDLMLVAVAVAAVFHVVSGCPPLPPAHALARLYFS